MVRRLLTTKQMIKKKKKEAHTDVFLKRGLPLGKSLGQGPVQTLASGEMTPEVSRGDERWEPGRPMTRPCAAPASVHTCGRADSESGVGRRRWDPRHQPGSCQWVEASGDQENQVGPSPTPRAGPGDGKERTRTDSSDTGFHLCDQAAWSLGSENPEK